MQTTIKKLTITLLVGSLLTIMGAQAQGKTDARCYDAANAGTVGAEGWTGCAGMYIVKDKTALQESLDNGYAIDYAGTEYSIGDSAHNVFTGQVKDMSSLFSDRDDFNQDIGYWDTSNVTDMSGMFANAQTFDQDIGGWDTSNVTDMSEMFGFAVNFNQDIGHWDTSKVTNMDYMFMFSEAFDQGLSGWSVQSLPSEPEAFYGEDAEGRHMSKAPDWSKAGIASEPEPTDPACYAAANAGSVGAADWAGCAGMYIVKDKAALQQGMDNGYAIDHAGTKYTFGDSAHNVFTGQVRDMHFLFADREGFNEDIGYWDTSNVTNISWMFSYAQAFNQDISGWDTSNVTDMMRMFDGTTAFNQDIGGWDTSNVTDMFAMFRSAQAFNQDIGSWDTSNVINMSEMFFSTVNFNQDIGGWNTSHVRNMDWMFANAQAFDQHIGGWDTSNVLRMRGMFNGATTFNQDISGWDITKISQNEAIGFDKGASSDWADDKKPKWPGE